MFVNEVAKQRNLIGAYRTFFHIISFEWKPAKSYVNQVHQALFPLSYVAETKVLLQLFQNEELLHYTLFSIPL